MKSRICGKVTKSISINKKTAQTFEIRAKSRLKKRPYALAHKLFNISYPFRKHFQEDVNIKSLFDKILTPEWQI